MSKTPEKRATNRFLAGVPVVLRVKGVEHACVGKNLSRSGVLLVGNLPRDAGPEVEVALRSAAGDLRVTCKARVIRSETTADGAVRLGLAFTDVDYEHRATLEALIARVVEGVAPAALDALPANATAQQMRQALESTPLAHRITLAMRAQPREREILFHDPNPQVIDALARNPQLLQTEVRAMLRMPQLLPSTLETLARDPRWGGNKELRILIASHHAAPFALAERLASGMDKESARRLVQAPGLNPALRTKLLQRFNL